MPLSNPTKEFVEWKGSHRKNAVYSYNLWITRFGAFTKKSLEEIDVKDIVVWSNYLDKNYSSTTKYYAMTILHMFFRFWNLRGKGMPADLIKCERLPANSHQEVTTEEYEKMLSVQDDSFTGVRNKCILRLLSECGMRISELTDLKMTDINLRDRYAIIKTKKTVRERRIVWSETTNSLLYQYIAEKSNQSDSPYLFIGFLSDDSPTVQLTPRSVQRMIKKACKDSFIEKKLSPHGFRHHFARERRRKGASIAFVQTALGHSTPLTTINTYQAYGVDEFQNEAEGYLDDNTPVYTPPLVKKRTVEREKFNLFKEALTQAKMGA